MFTKDRNVLYRYVWPKSLLPTDITDMIWLGRKMVFKVENPPPHFVLFNSILRYPKVEYYGYGFEGYGKLFKLDLDALVPIPKDFATVKVID